MTGEFAPRALIVAEAWRALGGGVEALSNAAGLPLARTTKLIVDPLVVRPVQRPHLARTLLDPASAAELTERIAAAAPDLRATSEWFMRMKRQRRARGITAGNPQEKYFQRAYELARTHGAPGDDADDIAGAEVEDVHGDTVVGAADLREFLADPAVAAAVEARIAEAWTGARDGQASDDRVGHDADGGRSTPAIDALLDACASGDEPLDALVEDRIGSDAGLRLRAPGVARAVGLSDRDGLVPPVVGRTASKNTLPRPFDRSILERLFVPIASLGIEGTRELRELVEQQAVRSAAPWQLGDEAGRVVMAAGVCAGEMDDATEAGRRLRDRWRREGFVRRAERMGGEAAHGAAEEFARRLWVRVHGRELRARPVAAGEVWDVLDGAMRSVILDRRDRVKSALAGTA